MHDKVILTIICSLSASSSLGAMWKYDRSVREIVKPKIKKVSIHGVGNVQLLIIYIHRYKKTSFADIYGVGLQFNASPCIYILRFSEYQENKI